jgi:hypothetical protein
MPGEKPKNQKHSRTSGIPIGCGKYFIENNYRGIVLSESIELFLIA